MEIRDTDPEDEKNPLLTTKGAYLAYLSCTENVFYMD